MSGLFGIIEAGKQSLFAQQSALQILNHNVANAGNPAYTRQRVLLGARSILGEMGLPQSGGVQVLGVQRITDHFLLGRVTRAQGEYGEQSALRASYDLMELAFGEPVDTSLGETGLGDDLRSFLDSWQLTLNPDGGGDSSDLAPVILENARALAQRFRSLSTSLLDQAEGTREDIELRLQESNRLLEDIASINGQLLEASMGDSARSDLIDSRQQSLLRLAQLTGCNWEEGERGDVRVLLGSRTLLDGRSAGRLSLETSLDSEARIPASVLKLDGQDIALELPAGEISGMMEALNVRLPEMLARVDRMAAAIVEHANRIHQEADGAPGGGIDIFSGTDASTIDLNSVLEGNPDLLSTAGVLEDGSTIAEAFYALHDMAMDANSSQSLESYYASTIGELGAKSAMAASFETSSLRTLEGVEQRLASVSGVSLDEELANMMMVQTAFQASSRVISVVDEMLDTLLATV